jgi:hypothetical protein
VERREFDQGRGQVPRPKLIGAVSRIGPAI